MFKRKTVSAQAYSLGRQALRQLGRAGRGFVRFSRTPRGQEALRAAGAISLFSLPMRVLLFAFRRFVATPRRA